MTAGWYLDRKLAGDCVYNRSCPHPAKEDSVMCDDHYRLVTEVRQRRRATDPKFTARQRRYQRRWRRRRFARGLCTMCPRPRDPDTFFCIACEDRLDSFNANRRPRHAKTVAAPVPATGLVSQAHAATG